ncbi:uncharacterized protein DS421_2g45180 [Arachis hypogaea]|nr:uncharacterized protein DS421_2g45180 [Arachis hypogaea]
MMEKEAKSTKEAKEAGVPLGALDVARQAYETERVLNTTQWAWHANYIFQRRKEVASLWACHLMLRAWHAKFVKSKSQRERVTWYFGCGTPGFGSREVILSSTMGVARRGICQSDLLSFK